MKKDKKQKQPKLKKLRSWYSDRYQTIVVQRNILFIFSAIMVLSMSFSIILLKYVVASKSLEPYVIEVEDKTGIATVVDQNTLKEFTAKDTVKKYFIHKFIQAAISYDHRSYKRNKESIRLMSTKNVHTQISRDITKQYNENGYNAVVIVRIKTIAFPDPNSSLVRVKVSKKIKNGSLTDKNYLISITFQFSSEIKFKESERLVNPLGFQVQSYLATEEIFDY